MKRAVKFYEEVRRGSSLPLLVGGDDGEKYIVKLNGAGDGALSNIAEWVSAKLGESLQIPVLQPFFVMIDASLAAQPGDPETRELLEKSIGINLGTPYLSEAFPYGERHAGEVNDFLQQRIFLFDVFLLNVDRTIMNPNMIVHGGNLWCLDYSSAIEIRSLVNGEPYREHVLLKHLKQHPFYQEGLNPYDFINRLKEIPDHLIRDVVDDIPTEWSGNLKTAKHGKTWREEMAEKLIQKKQHSIALRARLDLLRILQVETAEAFRARTLQNKNNFEKKYGKL